MKRQARVHEKIGTNLKAQKRGYNPETFTEIEGNEDDLKVEEQFLHGRDSDDEEINIELEKGRLGRLSTSLKKVTAGSFQSNIFKKTITGQSSRPLEGMNS